VRGGGASGALGRKKTQKYLRCIQSIDAPQKRYSEKLTEKNRNDRYVLWMVFIFYFIVIYGDVLVISNCNWYSNNASNYSVNCENLLEFTVKMQQSMLKEIAIEV